MTFMISCTQATQLVSRALDAQAAFSERLTLGLHLLACQGCRNYRRQLRILRLAARAHPARPDNEAS